MLLSVGFEKTGERIKKYMVSVEILLIRVSLAFLRDVRKALNIFYKKFLYGNIHNKIYHFNFLSILFSGIKNIHIIMQPSPLSISRILSSSKQKLDPLNNSSSFPLLPHQPLVTTTILSVSMNEAWYLIQVESCNICPFMSGLFHIACEFLL